MQFSKEQWQEINGARDRLEAIKNKVQSYPAYPEGEPPGPQPQVIEHIVRHSQMGAKEFDLLQQTALKVQYLDEKFTELLAKKKPRGKY